MTYHADPCIPINPIAETIRERLMEVLLKKTLPILWKEELSTRTNADLRSLISEIETVTGYSYLDNR